MSEEISIKDFQKLKDQVSKLEDKLSDQLKKLDQKSDQQIINLEKKLTENVNKLVSDLKDVLAKLDNKLNDQKETTNRKIEELANMFEKELKDKYAALENKLEENFKKLKEDMEFNFSNFDERLKKHGYNLENEVKTLQKDIRTLDNEFSSNLKNFKDEFLIKEEVLRDLIKKTNEENIEFKNNLNPILESLKSEQDLVKITVDVLKKQIRESAKEWIDDEIKIACKSKEREILMNLWIDEMKEIINNLDKLKELHPKELKLRINEISSIIDSFKNKFKK
ncbi:MAG: hypothetical protein ACFE9Z_12340 [Promethearchaeota archaeon]